MQEDTTNSIQFPAESSKEVLTEVPGAVAQMLLAQAVEVGRQSCTPPGSK